MSVARARALRGLQSALRSSNARALPRVSAPARTQLAVGRRWASGEGHGHAEPSSDLPWMAGAIAVTIPACWYLWPTANAHAEHDSHDSHDAHGGEEAHDEGAEEKDDSPKEDSEQSEEQGEQKDGEESKETEEKASSQDEAQGSGSDGSMDAGNKGSAGVEGDNIENKTLGERGYSPADQGKEGSDDQAETKDSSAGQQSKGNVKADSAANTETRKTEDDSKGGKKKRVDSGLQRDLGPSTESHDDDGVKDRAAPAKPTSDDVGDISKKQAGFSNSPTRHSTKIDEDPEKSKKSEGGPDTAKVMGTVDPNRPAK